MKKMEKHRQSGFSLEDVKGVVPFINKNSNNNDNELCYYY